MILFAILCLIILIVLAIIIVGVASFGAGAVIVFAEPIICILLIVWLITKLINH